MTRFLFNRSSQERQPNFSKLVNRRVRDMGDSGLGDLLKYAGDPKIKSLSAGSPDSKLFPIKEIIEAFTKVIGPEGYGPNLLQYGKARGFGPLLDVLPEFLSRSNRQVRTKSENIAITAGSQEALSILGELFLNPKGGTKIAVESPTYIGAVGAWKKFNPNYIEIPTDEFGIIPAELEKTFKKHKDIKFLYTIPTFQNPTGKTIPLEKRKEIARILQKYGKLAVEDDPYSELRYEGEDVPSIQSLAPKNVIHLFTFSKTVAPGGRVGGIVFPEQISTKEINNIMTPYNNIKTGQELFTSYVFQAIVSELIKDKTIDKHILKIRESYKLKRDVMAQTIQENFPDIFDVSVPSGGMFIWLRLKDEHKKLAKKLDIAKINQYIAKTYTSDLGVGKHFYAKRRILIEKLLHPKYKTNEVSMRLNFTNRTEEEIRLAIQSIGEVLKQILAGSLVLE